MNPSSSKNAIAPLLALLLICFLAASCNPQKRAMRKMNNSKAGKTVSKVRAHLEESRILPELFKAKAKIKAKGPDFSQNFSAELRLRKDSVLWISVFPTFAKIEVARMVISADSIKAIDRMGKNYYAEPTSLIEDYTQYPFSFDILQDAILGNNLLPFNSMTMMEEVDEGWRFSTEDESLSSRLLLDSEDMSISSMSVTDVKSDVSLSSTFDDYEQIGKYYFSLERFLSVISDPLAGLGEEAKPTYSAELTYSKVKFDEPLRFPFKVSSKYKKATLVIPE